MGDGPAPVVRLPRATVWTRENEHSSGGRTMMVPLEGLPEDAKELCGQYVCVDERDLGGNRFPCSPSDPNDGPGTRCFTQKFAYATLDRFIRFLSDRLDCDMELIRAIYRKRSRALPVRVNAPRLVDAFYSPSSEELTFGNGDGRFSLATDGDLLVHEATHWVIDVINPTLGEGFLSFGQAIHEGTADAVAALFFGDPQLSEDFNRYRHGRGYSGGIRSVKNTRTFRNAKDPDPHELGRVIGGYWWSLRGRMRTLLRQRNSQAMSPAKYDDLATNATIKLAIASAGSYRTPSPGPADFVEAVAEAVKGLAEVGELDELVKNNADIASVVALVRQEADARAFIWFESQLATDPPSTSPEGYSFGPPVALIGATGAPSNYHPQIHHTAHGPALVAGYGKFVRRGAVGAAEISSSRLRRMDAGSIDETVSISQAEARVRALAAVELDLGGFLARRRAWIAAPTRMHLIGEAHKGLQGAEGRLAILPKQRNLSWLFDVGVAHIAVDAQSGKTAFILKAIVD